MDQNGGLPNFRHRRSPSSDRFLDVFSPSKQSGALANSIEASAAGDELNEDDVFWTGDFTESQPPPTSPLSQNSLRQPFRQSEKFGILAALSEDRRNPNHPLIYRKHLLSPSSPSFQNSHGSSSGSPAAASISRPIRSIPKPQNYNGYSQSMPVRKFQQSAPVNVPMMPRKPRNSLLADVDVDDDDADDEMLPPHEIVARGSARSPKTTFSVLEGVGRTLKGRDLRQVRNAVWHQTGFLD